MGWNVTEDMAKFLLVHFGQVMARDAKQLKAFLHTSLWMEQPGETSVFSCPASNRHLRMAKWDGWQEFHVCLCACIQSWHWYKSVLDCQVHMVGRALILRRQESTLIFWFLRAASSVPICHNYLFPTA